MKGTITVSASYGKHSSGIEFYFPNTMKREYDLFPNMEVYTNAYPNIYWGEFAGSGVKPNVLYNVYGTQVNASEIVDTEEQKYVEMTDEIPDEDIDNTEGKKFLQEHGVELIEELNKEAFDGAYMFMTRLREVNKTIYDRVGVSFYYDEYRYEEDRKINDKKFAELIHQALEIDKDVKYRKELSEYKDARLRLTHWSGYCGPSALAFVYRGKYDHYPVDSPNNYIKLLGDGSGAHFSQDLDIEHPYAYYNILINTCGLNLDESLYSYVKRSSEADYGLSSCFYKECVISWLPSKKKSSGCNFKWQFPLYHGGMNRGLKMATDNHYGVKFTINPTDWIERLDQPVIIGVDCDHYVVAIGTGGVKKWWGEKRYFIAVDNGNKTGSDDRQFKYYPYWKEHNCLNLHYGVEKLK